MSPLRRFRPSLIPSLVTAAVLPVLVALGLWQLQRAEEKRMLFASFATPGEVLDLTQALARSPDTFPRTQARGSFDSARQLLLDAMPNQGVNGFHVWTPLRREDGAVLIVNRGWVPQGVTRAALPDIRVDEGVRAVRGRLREFPRAGVRLGAGMSASQTDWPRIVVFPTAGEIADALGEPVLPRLLALDSAEPDGFVRHWQPASFGPDRHVAYAVQWFALAVALLVIYVVVNTQRKGNDNELP